MIICFLFTGRSSLVNTKFIEDGKIAKMSLFSRVTVFPIPVKKLSNKWLIMATDFGNTNVLQ